MPIELNKKYGKLTPIYDTGKRTKNRNKIFHCLCECGNEIDVSSASLFSKNTRSCGCLRKISSKERGEKNRLKNKYDLTGEYGIGWSSNKNKKFYFDLEDYDKIKDYTWFSKKNKNNEEYYIYTKEWNNNKCKTIYMHIFILLKNEYKILKNFDVDHKNHKPYDNRKDNLRLCEHYKNITYSKTYINNTSGRKGVSWDKNKNKWIARLTFNKKTYYLGEFNNFNDAIQAREKAEEIYHKEYHYKD